MTVKSLATLEELRQHFNREDYVKSLLECANKRTDAETLQGIYEKFFCPDAIIRSQDKKKGLGVADLGQIMQYKLSRGKWRPRLQQLVESNDEDEIERITASIVDTDLLDLDEVLSLKEVQNKMNDLCRLKAVGPATASLVLGIFYPSVPFFSDEFAAFYPSVGGDKLKYTLKEYLALIEAHRSWLDEQQVHKESTAAHKTTSREAEEMIWYWVRSPPVPEIEDKRNLSKGRRRPLDEIDSLPKRSKTAHQ